MLVLTKVGRVSIHFIYYNFLGNPLFHRRTLEGKEFSWQSHEEADFLGMITMYQVDKVSPLITINLRKKS